MIAVIGDTHMPKGSRELPAECVAKIRGAEALIHAGDFSAASVLEQLQALCPFALAAHGMVAAPERRRGLRESLEVERGVETLGVVNEAAPGRRRVERM